MATQQTSAAGTTASSSSSSSSPPPPQSAAPPTDAQQAPRKKRKVGQACVYCRRSHMTCDSNRPCKRCIKRDIGHLCHDETPGKGHGHAHHAMPKKKTSMSASSTSADEPSAPAPEPASQPAPPPPPVPPTDLASAAPSAEALSAYISALASTSVAPHPAPYPSQASMPPVSLAFRPGAGLDSLVTAAPAEGPPLAQDTNSPWQQMSSSAAGLGGAGFLGLGGSDGFPYGGFGGGGGDAAGGNEFNLLSEFLESLDGPAGGNAGGEGMPSYDPSTSTSTFDPLSWSSSTADSIGPPTQRESPSPARAASAAAATTTSSPAHKRTISNSVGGSGAYAPPTLTGFSTKTEKFFLTAADQVDGPREQRLSKVIQAKYDAGLLRPYNHVKGYARLNTWMERNVSPASKRRILKPLSIFRPRFRAVAQSLSDVDLIFIEEAFERLLLDYDRVFSTQGIPACLWRRTGEIYKGNREFAELVGVSYEELRDGRLCIYELMEEESACNYWEKYGAVSFDPGQKAVLTSCVLVARQGTAPRGTFSRNAGVDSTASGATTSVAGAQSRRSSVAAPAGEEDGAGAALTTASSAPQTQTQTKAQTKIHCCFSFTIRRDAHGCPIAIAAHFIPTS